MDPSDINESPSLGSTSFLDSKSTQAFLIGLDLENEWEGDDGDVQMASQLRSTCGLPLERVVHLQDTDATRDNSICKLIAMLEKTQSGDTLIFYFGGHGEDDEFCTAGKPRLMHNDVIDVIEQYFRGERVVLLLDCCYSGNFSLKLHKRFGEGRTRLSYLCLASAPPWEEAGGADTFTKEWLRTVQLGVSTGNVTVKQLVSRLADAMAFEKKDVFTAYKCGPDFDLDAPFLPLLPQDKQQQMALRSDNAVEELVRDLEKHPTPSQTMEVNNTTESEWVKPISFSIGDKIYAKGDTDFTPCWFPGRIESVSKDAALNLEVELCDPITQRTWREKVARNETLDPLHFYHLEMKYSRKNAHVLLAKQKAYVSYAGMAPRTKVRVRWDENDGTQAFYEAEILRPRAVSWRRLITKETVTKYRAGPYIPVWWTEDDSESLVRPWRCVPADEKTPKEGAVTRDEELIETMSIAERLNEEMAAEIKSPREAILMGIRAAGKHVDSEALAGSNIGEDTTFQCYDAEAGKWSNVDVLKVERIPLQVYAGHLCYREQGPYLLVYWHEDGTLELVPKIFVRCRDQD